MAERVRVERLEVRVSEVEDGFVALCTQNAVMGAGPSPDSAVADLEAELRRWCAGLAPVTLEVIVQRRILLRLPDADPEPAGTRFLVHLIAAGEELRRANRAVAAEAPAPSACYAAVGALGELARRTPTALQRLAGTVEEIPPEECFDDRGHDPELALEEAHRHLYGAAGDLGACAYRLGKAHSAIGHIGHRGPAAGADGDDGPEGA